VNPKRKRETIPKIGVHIQGISSRGGKAETGMVRTLGTQGFGYKWRGYKQKQKLNHRRRRVENTGGRVCARKGNKKNQGRRDKNPQGTNHKTWKREDYRKSRTRLKGLRYSGRKRQGGAVLSDYRLKGRGEVPLVWGMR